MGRYINPGNMSKEAWLEANGKEVESIPDFTWVADNSLPVCLVDNGMFTAAAVAYDEREFQAFNLPTDTRKKRWFLVQKSVLEAAGF